MHEKATDEISFDIKLQSPDNLGMEAARKAIIETIRDSCGTNLKDALAIQANHSADFMISDACRNGKIGAEFKRLMNV